jgi:hypothetical protein
MLHSYALRATRGSAGIYLSCRTLYGTYICNYLLKGEDATQIEERIVSVFAISPLFVHPEYTWKPGVWSFFLLFIQYVACSKNV